MDDQVMSGAVMTDEKSVNDSGENIDDKAGLSIADLYDG